MDSNMDEPVDDSRESVLGFKPQRETPYNKLLPYADLFDEESNKQLAEIKTYLGRAIQLRDVKIGASHWTGQLAKYIRLYGHKYSKEDHLSFIHLFFELTTIPDLELTLVQRFAQLLCSLLKKRELLSRDDLVLPWKPLYDLVERTVYSRYEDHGLQLIPRNLEAILKNLVRYCRVYFSVESTAEMLSEWRPLMCPFDITMMKAMYYLELFLPTIMDPQHHQAGFKLWFSEFLGLWDTCEISPSWEGNLVNLFARLAVNNVGHVDWEPWLPKIFTRVLRSLSLPVGTNKIQVTRAHNNSYEINNTSVWIAHMLGGSTSTQAHIEKLLKALESFYHPSNSGKWSIKLVRFLVKLPQAVVSRLYRERHFKTWTTPVPESHRLTDDDITTFVDSFKPVVFLAMFSKFGSHDSAVALDQLALLRPERVIPMLLDKTYPALETLTEPHRLISCLNCVVGVARSMVGNHRWYPEGRTHVLPLLNLCLPGIDPNDIKKCLTTFQMISTLASLVPIVDCSTASQCRKDLTEEEQELCSASAQFEDFVLLFIDKLFVLIENSAQEHMRTDSQAAERLTHEETMLEVGMLSTFNAIMQQSSQPIYQEALRKLFRFVSTSVYETRVAGRFTSDLCRGAAKVNPEKALKLFIPHFCGIIKTRTANDEILHEEHLDNEFLWNLKLLSETVRCDSTYLLPLMEDLVCVLQATLHLKCKEAMDMAGNLLRHLLKALTLIFATDYRSSTHGWDKPLTEHLLIREWGQPGSLQDLQMKWHVPGEQQKAWATRLLQTFLVVELERIQAHTDGTTMSREELRQSLGIVVHCIAGAGSVLPVWDSRTVKLVDSLVPLSRFSATSSCDSAGISLEGKNVRRLIVDSVQPLLKHMLSQNEDDTKSLIQVIKVYQSVLFYHGTQKEEFDGRWKSLHIVKRSMENKFIGEKRHIRAVLVDRAQLQHELRVMNHVAKTLTELHRSLFLDLLSLGVSRYSMVRKLSQQVLGQGMRLYAYSYRALMDDVLYYIRSDPSIEHHQFKGALYIIHGESKRSLMTKHSWEVMNTVWPAMVQAPHSEKPSILKVVDHIMDNLHKNIEAADLKLKVSESAIQLSKEFWNRKSLPPSGALATAEELEQGRLAEDQRNADSVRLYYELVNKLVNLIETGNLHWRFHQMALEMLGLVMRHDIRMPRAAVELFTKNLVSETLQVRKISTAAVSALLKQQKRPHPKVLVDPYELSKTAAPSPGDPPQPGDRPDNMWHHYDDKALPTTQEAWDRTVFVEKTHWGYYTWPNKMYVYAPESEQPVLGRSLMELTDEEQPIYEHFCQRKFVDKLISFLSLEENKGKDKFHPRHFALFKGLFRNFDDSFVHLLRPHMERLVSDTRHDSHETSQRCAAEMISGIIRGSKHWTFEKVKTLWSWLIPVLKTAMSNMTVESMNDWGTCYATAAESQDPRKLHPIFELLLESQLTGEGGSFGDSSRLYVLQGALAQQEWRVPRLLHRMLAVLKPHLKHSYKIVRDRLGSVLVNLFLYDLPLPGTCSTVSPRRHAFVSYLLPQLELLKTSLASQGAAGYQNGSRPISAKPEHIVVPMETAASPGVSPGDVHMADVSRSELMETSFDQKLQSTTNDETNGESEEKKTAVKVCKSVMKWLQGSFSRMLHSSPPEIFQFMPIMCMLESETKDDELRQDAMYTLACMAQTLLAPEVVPVVMATIKQVSQSPMWHARAASLAYLQVMVFCNLFIMDAAGLVADVRALILKLLCDEQLEVREMAAVTFGGFLHCGFLQVDQETMDHFRKLSRTKLPRRQPLEAVKPELLIRRHAGILGLSACVQAFPYDVPDFMPLLLMDLSDHLDDPQLIQVTVKKTLSNFRRTHYDNWQDHKQKFTDDQLVVLTDLLVSPNYYA